MNIVVVGGGTPRKFGNDFVKFARTQGHNVFVLSHRHHNVTEHNTVVANFSSVEDTVKSFQSLVTDLDHIDLLLYNTNCGGWPNQPNNYVSTSTVNEKLYIHGFKVHVIIPHAIAVEAMRKMSNTSKIVFMTTDMIYDKERSKYIANVGYAGGKAYQHQLMLALAEYNDKNITVSSLSPFFNYNDLTEYSAVFNKASKHLLEHGAEFNAKVFDCWD